MIISFKNQCDFPSNRVDVRFTKCCDNACPFCVERTGIHTLGKLEVEKMAESTKGLKPDNVGILGGEPMLFPEKVLEYIAAIREEVPKIYITTSLPKVVDEKWDSLSRKIFAAVDGVNVSILADNWEDHNRVLHASSGHNRFEILQRIAREFPEKLRVCINLYKGGIDSREKLEGLMETLASWGVRSVKLNEIQWDTEGYISFADMYGLKLKSAYAFGCYKELTAGVLKEKFPEVKIMLHRSCCWSQPSIPMSWWDGLKDILKFIRFRTVGRKYFRVVYENGEVSNGWRGEEGA